MSTDPTVRRLADLEEIRDLARRYAHHVWRLDVAAVVDLFTDDGVMDSGERPAIVGREALQQGFTDMLSTSAFLPFVQQHVVDLDGDHATGACYVDLRATVEGRSIIGAGHYDDVYRRTERGWKIAERRLTLAFLSPLAEGWAESKPDD